MTTARILIVEDQGIVAKDIENKLRQVGYVVPAIAFSGEEAIQRAAETRPDLVLMDIRLPGEMDGIAAAKEIQAWFDIPVVYLTAYADEETVERARVSEPFGYVLKPFDTRALRSAIEVALYKHEMDKKLKESEERLRTIFAASPDCVYLTDTEGSILDANSALLELVGLSLEQMRKKNVLDFFAGDDPGKLLQAAARLRSGEEVRGLEAQARIATGEVRDYEIHAIPLKENGAVTAILSVARDITERKRAEEALRKSKELFEKTFISQRDAIFILDAKTPPMILDCNPATTRVFGYTRQEILGRTTVFLHVDETVLKKFQEQLYPAIAERGFLHLPEFEMRRKDGTVFPTEHSVMPLEDEKGNRIGWVSVVRDITERKRVEEALRESEERFRTIVETAPSLLLITDAEGNNIYVSPNCEEITGYTQEELQGRVVWWVHEDDRPRAKAIYDRTFREGVGCKDLEYKAVKKNGELWYGSSSWEPFRDAEGKLQGVVFQTTDITERKRVEEELQRLYEQAQRDAETKATLLDEVNHRVKNNLLAIIGLLYAERRYAERTDQVVYRAITQNLMNRVGGLTTVHSLLTASDWAPLLLSDLAGQIVHSSLQMLPRHKGVSIDVTPSPVQVTADQAHSLALVINELATNTVKHALEERDTAHIAVRITLEDEDDTVRFEFRDDGPGYPEDVLQLERYRVGFDLIQNMVRTGLRGELSLHNDGGAVAVIRFKAQA
jgi:PAS domain S-box-containing protein